MTPSNSLPLPNELLVQILTDLSISDLVCCRSANRALKELIDETPSLQYKVELFLAGMLDTGSGKCDTRSALSQLREREDAWNKFQPLRESSLFLPRGEHINRNILADYHLSRENPSRSVAIFHQISPQARWGLPQQWSIQLDFPVQTLSAYPEADLLVAVQPDIINIHLLSLSSGGPHPLAEKPCFHVQPELVEWDGPTVSVAGDFLRVSNTDDASGENSDIWVWNWKTGKLHLNAFHDQNSEVHHSTEGTSAEFLNEHLLLLPVLEGLDKDYGHTECVIIIYDCTQQVEGRIPYRDIPRLATFRLPRVKDTANYRKISAFSDPHGMPHHQHHPEPFVPDPALRIFAFQMELLVPSHPWFWELPVNTNTTFDRNKANPGSLPLEDGGWARLLLFVPASTFLRFCSQSPPGATLEWEQWSAYARLIHKPGKWLHEPPSHRRVCVPEDRPNAPHCVMLYDFAPPAALRRRETDTGPWEYVMSPSVLVNDLVFEGRVVSSLPYRKVNTGYFDPSRRLSSRDWQVEYRLTDDGMLARTNIQPLADTAWNIHMFA